jgi:uncharacterized membrane protein
MEGCHHTRRNWIIAILVIVVLVLIGYIYILMKGVAAAMNKMSDGITGMLQGYWQMTNVPGRYLLIKGSAMRVVYINKTASPPTFETQFATDDAKFSIPKLTVSGKYEIKMSYATHSVDKLLLVNPTILTLSPTDGTMMYDDIKLVRDNEMSAEVSGY